MENPSLLHVLWSYCWFAVLLSRSTLPRFHMEHFVLWKGIPFFRDSVSGSMVDFPSNIFQKPRQLTYKSSSNFKKKSCERWYGHCFQHPSGRTTTITIQFVSAQKVVVIHLFVALDNATKVSAKCNVLCCFSVIKYQLPNHKSTVKNLMPSLCKKNLIILGNSPDLFLRCLNLKRHYVTSGTTKKIEAISMDGMNFTHPLPWSLGAGTPQMAHLYRGPLPWLCEQFFHLRVTFFWFEGRFLYGASLRWKVKWQGFEIPNPHLEP